MAPNVLFENAEYRVIFDEGSKTFVNLDQMVRFKDDENSPENLTEVN